MGNNIVELSVNLTIISSPVKQGDPLNGYVTVYNNANTSWTGHAYIHALFDGSEIERWADISNVGSGINGDTILMYNYVSPGAIAALGPAPPLVSEWPIGTHTYCVEIY